MQICLLKFKKCWCTTINVIKQINCEETTFASSVDYLLELRTNGAATPFSTVKHTNKTNRTKSKQLFMISCCRSSFLLCWQPPIGRCNLHGQPFHTPSQLKNCKICLLIYSSSKYLPLAVTRHVGQSHEMINYRVTCLLCATQIYTCV